MKERHFRNLYKTTHKDCKGNLCTHKEKTMKKCINRYRIFYMKSNSKQTIKNLD